MNDIEEITKTLVQSKVIAAIKETPEYIDDLVQAAMNQEVDEHGGKPDYHSKTKMPWLEWRVRSSIQQLTTQIVSDLIKQEESAIRESVKRALTTDDIVTAFANRFISGVADYRISVEVLPDAESR